jgi:benzoate membrane transport protein
MTFSTIAAGIVAALAGFGGSIAVVLAAAAAVGATPAETTSWVTALCAAMAATTAILTVSSRIPITTAWSTPGAAVIAATAGTISFPAATGAFLVAGVLVVLTALIRPLGQLVERIPLPIASGMLAGVLLRFVLAIFESLQAQPLLVLPLVALFLILRLWNPAMAALVVMVAGIPYAWGLGLAPMTVPFDVSRVAVTAPYFDPAVLIGLAVPLYVVTMAGQNLAGAAVLRAAGYTVPFNRSLMVTGLTSILIAPFGGHTIGLSAIASAICTGPDTHPDPAKRWPAGISLAITYTLITVFAGALVALFLALPPELMRTVAGLALMTSLIGALSSATGDPELRFAAILTFAVTASGLTIAGVGAAFWGLVAGLLAHVLERGWAGRKR